MDSNLSLQLEDLSLRDSQTRSRGPSQRFPSSTPCPCSSLSLSSLPPELISNIFDSLPDHPASERNSTLTSLCLVNHLFLDLARPVLYREVFLNLNTNYENPTSRFRELVRTLVDYPECADLVKGIRISAAEAPDSYMVILAYVLSHLRHLKWIRTSWEHAFFEDGGEELIKLILKHQPRLRSLALPDVGLRYSTLDTIFSHLTELESYKGILPGPPESDSDPPFPNLSCTFRKLVLLGPDPTSFKQLTRFSHESLSSLGFSVSLGNAAFNLSNFPNLVNLRLDLEEIYSDATLDPVLAKLLWVQEIRRILLSARNVKNLSVLTGTDHIGYLLRLERLFDVLPSSLEHLTSVPAFLLKEHVNHSLLVEAIRSRSLPHLRRITIIPAYMGNWVNEFHRTQQIMAQENLEEVCKIFGIAIERMGVVGTFLHIGYGIDPVEEDTTTDDEEGRSEPESEGNTSEEESGDSTERSETNEGSDGDDTGINRGEDQDPEAEEVSDED